MQKRKIDKFFLLVVIIILTFGFVAFFSATLSLLNTDNLLFGSTIKKYLIVLLLGFLALYTGIKIPISWIRKNSLYIFIISIFITLLLFIPALGMEHGGAIRWLDLGVFSLQPSELMKLGIVFYLATLLNTIKHREQPFYALFYVGIALFVPLLLLLHQPDNGTIVIIVVTLTGMYFANNPKIKHLATLISILTILFAILVYTQPYVLDRFATLLEQEVDILDSGYQVNQSKITIGSGGLFGRGIGQGIQKFHYLPEPNSDSIFAVVAEETGFVGSVIVVFLFLAFALRGFHIAKNSKNTYSGLVVVGIVILIVAQSFLNIASMLGLVPLSGMPLIFFSHGGTATITMLFLVGIILNISKTSQ